MLEEEGRPGMSEKRVMKRIFRQEDGETCITTMYYSPKIVTIFK
jgi:hypothetical protein